MTTTPASRCSLTGRSQLGRSLLCLSFLAVGFVAFAANPRLLAQDGAALSVEALAAELGEAVLDGDSATRLRIKVKPAGEGEEQVLQVQIKSRRSPAESEIVYQLMWPKERQGESFLLRQLDGKPIEGIAYWPPETFKKMDRTVVQEPIFGSDLTYQDAIENFYRWSTQKAAGEETVERVACQIIESVPGQGDATPYSKVRSWIDPRRKVAMKVEKYGQDGQVVSRIETTRVYKNDLGRYVPASFRVTRAGSGSVTEIEGSNLRHDLTYEDKAFEVESLNDYRLPPRQ